MLQSISAPLHFNFPKPLSIPRQTSSNNNVLRQNSPEDLPSMQILKKPESKKELCMHVSEGDFSIVYPSWWTKIQPSSEQVLFISPRTHMRQFCENISVVRESLANELSLDEYTQATLVQITREPGTQILHSGNTLVAGMRAHEVIYTGWQQDIPIVFKQIWLVQQSKVYILTLTSEASKFPSCQEFAQQLMNSFRLL